MAFVIVNDESVCRILKLKIRLLTCLLQFQCESCSEYPFFPILSAFSYCFFTSATLYVSLDLDMLHTYNLKTLATTSKRWRKFRQSKKKSELVSQLTLRSDCLSFERRRYECNCMTYWCGCLSYMWRDFLFHRNKEQCGINVKFTTEQTSFQA